jgi:hypothetical protein
MYRNNKKRAIAMYNPQIYKQMSHLDLLLQKPKAWNIKICTLDTKSLECKNMQSNL